MSIHSSKPRWQAFRVSVSKLHSAGPPGPYHCQVDPNEAHVRSLICESVCLCVVKYSQLPGGVRLQWAFKSLMSKRCVKKSHCGKSFLCIFTLVRGEDEHKRRMEMRMKSSEAWKTHPARVHEKRKEAGVVIIFSPVFFSPLLGPRKEPLGSICGPVPPQLS